MDTKNAPNYTYSANLVFKNIIFSINPEHFVQQEDHTGTKVVTY